MERAQINTFFVIALAIQFSVSIARAQSEPVNWLIKIDSVSKNKGVLVCKANILPGWHLYSQHIREGGPMPTKFVYSEQGYRTVGQTAEKGKRTIYYDELYDMEVAWYSDQVVFTQRLQQVDAKSFVKGMIEYMVCNGEICMPGKKTFIVPIVAH